MKLNVSAGKQTWPGFYCIDAVQHPKATRKLDLIYVFEFHKDGSMVNQIPLEDGCASEIHCYHFIEHVFEWEAPAVIQEFHRLLKKGGQLIMELPNLEHACRNLLKGTSDQFSYWPLYGDGTHKDPYMCHKFGYTPKTIKRLVCSNGFSNPVVGKPQVHGRRANRDMRIEAVK